MHIQWWNFITVNICYKKRESNSGNNDQCQNASKCQINKVYFHKKAKERVEVQVFPVTVVTPGGKERTDQHIIYNMTNNNKMVTCEVDSVVDWLSRSCDVSSLSKSWDVSSDIPVNKPLLSGTAGIDWTKEITFSCFAFHLYCSESISHRAEVDISWIQVVKVKLEPRFHLTAPAIKQIKARIIL